MGKILITGAAGFIGYHTAMALKTEAIGIDNFNDYYSPALKRARAENLAQAGVEVIEHSILDKQFLMNLIEERKIEAIIHLAAQAGVRYSLIYPETYIENNIQGFLAVLEAVRAYPHVKLIYASSSSVYGKNEKTPYSTDDRTDNQASLYGVTKKTNELMASTYHHLFNLDVVGLRFFTVYGPWGRPDMAYFSFTEAIVAGKTIELYHYGNCERDFTYIDDIVQGILASLKLPKGCHLFNLGNHAPVNIKKFVEILEKLLNKKADVKLMPLVKGDVVNTFADIDESEKFLRFKPVTNLEEGLKRFVEWYKTDFKNIR